MAKRVNFKMARAALNKLNTLAQDPTLTSGTGRWADNLEELNAILGPKDKSGAEIQKEFRERKKAAGFKSYSFWLDAETAAALEDLADRNPGSTKGQILVRLIHDALARPPHES